MLTVGVMLCYVWGYRARIEQRSDPVVKGPSNVAGGAKQRLGQSARVTTGRHCKSFVQQTKSKPPETGIAQRSSRPRRYTYN